MWLEPRLARLVDEFWEAQPCKPESFPRNLVDAAPLALPVVIYQIISLSIRDVKQWLRMRGLFDPLPQSDRCLHGCLLAFGGYGLVFVDASDPDMEQRFTIAHEIAHFLLDYQEPRKRAIEALGDGIIPVLDGLRLPSLAERLDSILGETPLGHHVDLLERAGDGIYTSSATLQAEGQADRLAFELLAPATDVSSAISIKGEADGESPSLDFAFQLERAKELICSRYGLPQEQAAWYVGWVLKKKGRRPGVREWLGLVE